MITARNGASGQVFDWSTKFRLVARIQGLSIDTTHNFHFEGLFKTCANHAIQCNFISRKIPRYLWCVARTREEYGHILLVQKLSQSKCFLYQKERLLTSFPPLKWIKITSFNVYLNLSLIFYDQLSAVGNIVLHNSR